MFAMGKFGAAAARYTEAICLFPTNSVLYSNRAVCHHRMGRIPQCVDDCRRALDIDSMNTRAHHYLGVSLCSIGEWREGLAALDTALERARRQQRPAEYIREIQAAREAKRRERFMMDDADAEAKDVELQTFVQECVAKAAEDVRPVMQARVAALFDGMHRKRATREVPPPFVCPISLSIMRDPVCTPSGVSYERHMIEEALTLKAEDPFTRKHLTKSMLVPNRNLQQAIEHFVEENPWATEAT